MKFLKSYPSRLMLIQLRGRNPNGFFDIVFQSFGTDNWVRQDYGNGQFSFNRRIVALPAEPFKPCLCLALTIDEYRSSLQENIKQCI